jgi:hypothetical protein
LPCYVLTKNTLGLAFSFAGMLSEEVMCDTYSKHESCESFLVKNALRQKRSLRESGVHDTFEIYNVE